jgi:hypothetical protein
VNFDKAWIFNKIDPSSSDHLTSTPRPLSKLIP